MRILTNFLITALVVFALANILPGITVNGFGGAVAVAIILALLNAFVRPVIKFFAFPFTLITFGLFLFVINAAIILLAGKILGNSFTVDNFWWALLFSILLSGVESFLGFPKKKEVKK